MKEFIVLIYINGDPILTLPIARQQQHIAKVGRFIQSLASEGRLKNAQPFEPSGVAIRGSDGVFHETELQAGREQVVGFYHLIAHDLTEATAIIKTDPRFDDAEWTLAIWPILKLDGIN